MARILPSQVVSYIDSAFLFASSQQARQEIGLDAGSANQVAALLELLDKIPGELVSLDEQPSVEFFASKAALHEALQNWRRRGNQAERIVKVEGLRPLNPITMIREALLACPDAIPPQDVEELAFLPNSLRHVLRQDVAEAETALHVGSWKATTVLAGSILEALLLWALQQVDDQELERAKAAKPDPRRPSEINKWTLNSLVDVAAQLNVILSDTASQARLTKNFRNLIHPGAVEREGQTCDRGTARSAMAAVEHTIRDLDQHFHSTAAWGSS
jgi:hypothetical protein